jgi:hypothetical protein
VSERQDVIGDLEESGVLAGIRWAYQAAASRTMEIFSEADGHDAAMLGSLRHTLFRDRLDRAFVCGRYELRPGSAATDQLDLLYAELSQDDIRTMPQLAPGLVRRADLIGSPGWAIRPRRFLLAACPFGKLDTLPWPRRSPTKQRVARQPQLHPAQGSLFEDLADEEIAGIEELLRPTYQLDLDTFVVAHTLDPLSQDIEVVFGRARLNNGGGQAWHWYQSLLTEPRAKGGQHHGESPQAIGPDSAPDAPVRLRREQPGGRASGEA